MRDNEVEEVEVESSIFRHLTRNPMKVRKAYNKLMDLGQNNNIALEVTVTEGYEIPSGMSFPLAVVLASSQFHLDIDDIFNLRRGGHLGNREGDPVDWDDIQHHMNIAHNCLVLRYGGGDGISIMVVATDMTNNNNSPISCGE